MIGEPCAQCGENPEPSPQLTNNDPNSAGVKNESHGVNKDSGVLPLPVAPLVTLDMGNPPNDGLVSSEKTPDWVPYREIMKSGIDAQVPGITLCVNVGPDEKVTQGGPMSTVVFQGAGLDLELLAGLAPAQQIDSDTANK